MICGQDIATLQCEVSKNKCAKAPSSERRLSESTGTGVSILINMQAKLDTWEAKNMPLPDNIQAIPGYKVSEKARCAPWSRAASG